MKLHGSNGIFELSSKQIPSLVHSKDGFGGSHFTMVWMRDLFLKGEKMLFISAHPAAKKRFLEETLDVPDTRIMISKEEELQSAAQKQVILLEQDDEVLFSKSISMLPDIEERIVIVKNIDHFSENIYKSVKGLSNVIFSGDLDTCSWKDRLLEQSLKSRIYFSQPVSKEIPELQKYEGYLESAEYNGCFRLG